MLQSYPSDFFTNNTLNLVTAPFPGSVHDTNSYLFINKTTMNLKRGEAFIN